MYLSLRIKDALRNIITVDSAIVNVAIRPDNTTAVIAYTGKMISN